MVGSTWLLKIILNHVGYNIELLVLIPMTKNGTSKKKIRHIVDNSLSLLAHNRVPFEFWDYAFSTSFIFNINSIPSRSHGTPLIEKLFSTKPNYSFLQVFGYQVFP